MNKLVLVLIGSFFAFFAHGLSSWQSPEPHVRYHDVCFLTAHNAYASIAHGYRYAQQRLSLNDQLTAGVRGLMLDTHLDNHGRVILCHRNETINRVICGKQKPMLLDEALCTIKEFLVNHPTEIITIFLENYVVPRDVIDEPFIRTGLQKFILTPTEYNPSKNNGWPTIGWLQKHNKRLIIFDSMGETSLAYNQWKEVIENQWGALTTAHACRERWESKMYRHHNRYLYILNYFPKMKFNYGKSYASINSSMLEEFLKHAKKGLKGGLYKNRMPNFVSIDFIDEGDGMRQVQAINSSSACKAKL